MQSVEFAASVFFALAILHTFSVKIFQHLARQYPEGSVLENLFHWLGEVEIVFGLWAFVFLAYFALKVSPAEANSYLQSCSFTEPLFVFVIMSLCSSKPVLNLAAQSLNLSRFLPCNKSVSFYWVALVIGPLLGSFITEPAAMTLTALILLERFYKKNISSALKYATLGLLFVNISIGGTLTPFAAPPVLMVAAKWNWGLLFMLQNFGVRAIVAIVVSTSLVCWHFRKELRGHTEEKSQSHRIPFWVSAMHLLFLAPIVIFAHAPILFVGFFLLFLGFVRATKEYQSELKIKEGLLVGFFLGGLVVLGGPQRWWLEPLLAQLSELQLYLGAVVLTAVTDNAALTYLGSQVPSLSDASKYFLVAGSVVGGGLTVIANAPNPAGYGILNSSFGPEGISPLRLFKNALLPTLIAGLCFFLFR